MNKTLNELKIFKKATELISYCLFAILFVLILLGERELSIYTTIPLTGFICSYGTAKWVGEMLYGKSKTEE